MVLSEMTCYLHMFLVSGGTSNRCWSLHPIAWALLSQTTLELGIVDPYYRVHQAQTLNAGPWSQSSHIWATSNTDERLGWNVDIDVYQLLSSFSIQCSLYATCYSIYIPIISTTHDHWYAFLKCVPPQTPGETSFKMYVWYQ